MRPAGASLAKFLLPLLAALILAGCQTVSERDEARRNYDLAALRSAVLLSDPALRFFPEMRPDYGRATGWAFTGGPLLDDDRFDMLALSSGGPDGAFGVGILSGLTRAGKRPQYEVVTGVSTGALIAPFAFVGAKYDGLLEDLYTGKKLGSLIGAPNYFRALAGGPVYEARNLKAMIEKLVTPELLAEIAMLNDRGRRLYVATANLDADQLTVWDMGRIARKATPESVELFRTVIEAAVSIPGALEPVRITARTPQGPITELHGDGALLANFFADPALVPETCRAFTGNACNPGLSVIVHNRLNPAPQAQEASLVPLVKKSVSALSRTSTRLLLRQTWLEANARAIPMAYASLPADWKEVSALDLDRGYMKEAFDLGRELALSGAVWNTAEP